MDKKAFLSSMDKLKSKREKQTAKVESLKKKTEEAFSDIDKTDIEMLHLIKEYGNATDKEIMETLVEYSINKTNRSYETEMSKSDNTQTEKNESTEIKRMGI